MSKREYDELIDQAIAALPEQFRRAIRNVAFVVVDRVGRSGGRRSRRRCELLGLYEGIPLNERGAEADGSLPDKITLFRVAIEKEAGEEKEIPRVVRETVWHEIAHYFGFDEDGARRLERKWEIDPDNNARSTPHRGRD